MKGRPRKPLKELKTLGIFRGDRHADRVNEPQFDGEPVKPRGLDAKASRLWDSIVPVLTAKGVTKKIDTSVLVSVCQLWSLYQKAVNAAQKLPTDKECRGAVTGYWTAFDKAAAHCGLNPIDRAKLSVPPGQDADDIEGFARKHKPA